MTTAVLRKCVDCGDLFEWRGGAARNRIRCRTCQTRRNLEIDERRRERIAAQVTELQDHLPARPCGQPTDAQPGTTEKIAVLATRLESGVELFHPRDNQHPYLWLDVVRYVDRLTPATC